MPRPAERAALALMVAAFLGGHLFFLARSLEDIDSVNFALAVRSYDIRSHQPHPPGYPVYVALGKTGTALASALPAGPGTGTVVPEARGLALWGALFGAVAAVPFYIVFRYLEPRQGCALAATAMTLANPLMWMTASRPVSDVPGLAVVGVVQALLLLALHRRDAARTSLAASPDIETGVEAPGARVLALAALGAGLAAGVRSQTLLLTAPLLGVVVAGEWRGRGARALAAPLSCFALGVLAWAVPMVVASGGLGAYLDVLSVQAGEDLAGVEMFATHPTPRRLAFGLIETFVLPWADARLAAVVLVAAAGGAAVLLAKRPGRAALLVVVAVPYLAFHLLFQETVTTRYALPLVPWVAFLAARGLAAVGPVALSVGTLGVVTASLLVAVPALAAYSREGSPVARAVADLRRHGAGEPAVAAMDFALARALRGEDLGMPVVPSPVKHEWLALAEYWRTGGDRPIWYLGSPTRTDLALVDPVSRRVRGRYRWAFDTHALLGGVRPSEVDWIEIRSPGWFAGSGWHLTPEAAGVARSDGVGPTRSPITAWVRRRPEAATMLMGGRNLGTAGSAAVRVTLSIDGLRRVEQVVEPAPGFFVAFVDLAAGELVGEGPFAQVTIAARAADGSPQRVDAAIEQFDVQSADRPLLAFDAGWHEPEYEPSTGRLWRWTSSRSTLKVHPVVGNVNVTVEGESSLRYFDEPSTVTLTACDEHVGRLTATRDFTWTVRVSGSTLARCQGDMAIETNQIFVPDERSRNGDRRRLGLRIYRVHLAHGAPAAR